MIQNPGTPGTPGTPGNSGENDPAVVTFGGPADVLALVSYALGFTPEDSFVVIGLNGNRTGAVLRMDLPPEGDPIAAAAEAHYAAEIISAHHDASLVVLYTDTAPADPNAPFGFIDPSGRDAQDDPRIHSVLREALGIALEAAQAPIRTVWQTGGGYVRDYDCTDITCCPYPGESTDAVKYSQVAAAATLRGNTVDSSPLKRAEAYSTALTPAQRAIAPKVRDLVARLADSQPATQATQDADIAAVYLEAWTEALIIGKAAVTLPPDDTENAPLDALAYDPHRLARLVASFTSPDLITAVITLAATDPAALDYGHMITDGGLTDPHDPTATTLQHTTLAGATGEAPDWHRIDALAQVITTIGHHLTPEDRHQATAVAAWIEWARGRGSSAAALWQTIPDNTPGLPHTLKTALDPHRISPWAQNKETSYTQRPHTH